MDLEPELLDPSREPVSKPLVVSPREACKLLSVGLTRLYDLINADELDSFLIGRSRRITLASVHAYMNRHRDSARRTRPAEPAQKETPNAASFNAVFEHTAASMTKVIEAMTDRVMCAISREMRDLGLNGDATSDRELHQAIYALVARNAIEGTVRKITKAPG